MRSFLLWLENALAYMVRIFFLLGMLSGTAFFFMHSVLPGNVLEIMGGVSAAFFTLSVEGFVYGQQVRLNAAWTAFQKTSPATEQRRRMARDLTIAVIAMACVWGVSCVTSFSFWLYLVHPSDAFTWAEVITLGFVIPTLYVASGLMAKVRMDATEVLAQHADDMTLRALHHIGSQWKSRLERAVEREHDLAPIAVTLMEDAGEVDGARRVSTIAKGLQATEAGRTVLPSPVKSPKSYSSQTRSNAGLAGSAIDTHFLPASAAEEMTSRRPITLLGRKARKAVRLTPKERVFAVLSDNPGVSISDIQRAAKVSKPTAIKFRNIWLKQNTLQLVNE